MSERTEEPVATGSVLQTRRRIVDLLPGYLLQRRAGWTPASSSAGSVTLSDYLLLRRVAIERDAGPIPMVELQANLPDPYRTLDPILKGLPLLVARGLLDHRDDAYVLTAAGNELLTRNERAANDYTARRLRLLPDDLSRLASTLSDLAERLRQAPEPAIKAHQERVPRLRRFDQRQTPSVRLEYALYALQRARDDAHIAAWRAAGFRGPPLELLSRVWAGASMIAELVEQARGRMRAEDVAALVDELDRDGLLSLEDPAVTITERGRAVRDAIERETDRVFFAPWPAIDAEWVVDQLEALGASLSPHSLSDDPGGPPDQ
jgi:hypothetical protein